MNNKTIKFDILHDDEPAVRNDLRKQLRQWTIQKASQWDSAQQQHSLTVTATDDHDNLLGGVFGNLFLGNLFIQILFVEPNCQKQHLGTQLMRKIETEAIKLNCKSINLDTLEFQAPRFYEKLGYTEFGRFAYSPTGPTKIFLGKQLPYLPTTQQHQEFSKTITITKEITYNYLLHLPPHYEHPETTPGNENGWPMIVFLHGAGERGDDLEMIKVHGIPKVIENNPNFPFVAVSPQCPAGKWWCGEELIGLVDDAISRYNVDRNRIYITGLSMGGHGTWDLICHYPDRFAAAIPICGANSNPLLAQQVKNLPVWAFHGDKDNVVPLRYSQDMVNAIQAAGGHAKLTIYPGVEHDSWTQTFENKMIYDWLLSHKKQPPTQNNSSK